MKSHHSALASSPPPERVEPLLRGRGQRKFAGRRMDPRCNWRVALVLLYVFWPSAPSRNSPTRLGATKLRRRAQLSGRRPTRCPFQSTLRGDRRSSCSEKITLTATCTDNLPRRIESTGDTSGRTRSPRSALSIPAIRALRNPSGLGDRRAAKTKISAT